MGGVLAKIEDWWKQKPYRLLMLGLDSVGKTTMLYRMKGMNNVTTIPTIGFNVEVVQANAEVELCIWDVGGGCKIMALWRHYFPHTSGIMYVVDSSDRERLPEAKDTLYTFILQCEEARHIPIFVLANKQDRTGAMSPSEIADGLGLPTVTDRQWFVRGTSAITGQGLAEVLDAVAKAIKHPTR